MAANWGKIKYDTCNYEQELNMSLGPGMYNSFLSRYENELGVNGDNLPCNAELMKKLNCSPCDYNKGAKVNNDFNGLTNQLLDIDTDLRVYPKTNSKCVNTKYQGTSKGELFYNNDMNVVNPILCDRSIVPTNLKKPVDCGFDSVEYLKK